MKKPVKKYTEEKVKKHCLFFLFMCIGLFVHAQDGLKMDTTGRLKYQLDSLPADSGEVMKRKETDIVASEIPADQQEHFLRKEFTGGYGDSLASIRQIPDTALNALKKDKAFWYVNSTFNKKRGGEKGSFTGHPLFQTILWIVIITGFVIFLFLYLANSNISLFRRSMDITAKEEASDEIDIFAIDYQVEINKAITSEDYRLAVRLMFLQLLRNLSDRNIIEYKAGNTNLDYQQQLLQTNLHAGFTWLARNYEYTWYGHFDINKEKFELIKKEYGMFEYKNL